jgi:hypothetical protein
MVDNPNRQPLFSLVDARTLLPTLVPWVARMVQARQSLEGLIPDVEAMLQRSGANGGNRPSAKAVLHLEALREAIEHIQSHGVTVKDMVVGLLDFPCLREGEVVLRCWRLGEDDIRFWHEQDAGFQGRKPLDFA